MSNQLSIYNLIPQQKQQLALNETYVGIDFGTSTTVASICTMDGSKQIKTVAIPFKQTLADGRLQEHHLLPSVIAWVNNQLLIGKGAYELKYKLTEGVNLWHSFKMELGTDLGPKYFNSQLCAGHPLATIESPRDAALVFFNFVRQGIEAFVEENGLSTIIRYAVSIPAAFEANQRRELLDVLHEIGLSNDRHVFIDEPNAAFINYLVEYNHNSFKHYQIPDDSPLHILVFDFGAGTCDISLLALENKGSSFTTKNLSISNFLPLGGNDIDRAIARQILLPQVFAHNQLDEDALKKVDIDKRILPRLMGIAEQLKINVCKNVRVQMLGNRLSDLAFSDKTVRITANSEIKTPKMTLKLGEFYLSYAAFSELMKPFLDPFSSHDMCSDDGNIVSIFSPINSALNKADLTMDQIDLQLMIGGSAQNPYVIDALSNQFPELEIEVPQDLQSHVSCGTSIYSRLIHGMDFDLIQPITSEPLLYMTQEGVKVLVPANTPIPSHSVLFEPLRVGTDQQKLIEIPIFISTNDKLLHVIRVTEPRGKGFPINTLVQLNVQVTENKLVSVQVNIDGWAATVEYLNPFANHKLSPNESIVLDKFKKANISALNNNGRPTIAALNELIKAYANAGQHLKAAELLDNLQQMQPDRQALTSLCYHYAMAGKKKQAQYWAEQAYAKDKSSSTAYNLALDYKTSNEERYCQLMQEGLAMYDSDVCILQVYGAYLLDKDDPQGEPMLKKALKLLSADLNAGTISTSYLDRLIFCARRLDAVDVLEKATQERDKRKQGNKGYDEANLLQSVRIQLEQL